MSKTISLPDLPAKAVDATLRCWLCEPGRPVAAGEMLAELETTTQLVRLKAAAAGRVVKAIAQPGQTLKAGAALCEFEEGDSGEAKVAAPKLEKTATHAPKTEKKEPKMAEPTGDVTVVTMPKAGNDMEEGTVLKWLVSESDAVEKGQVLFELETDKATMEIESEAAGTVQKIVVAEGEMVAIHTPLAYIGDSADDVAKFIASQGGEEAEAAPTAAPEAPPEGVTVVAMPKAGNDMEEGTVLKWLVSEGDSVDKGQVLFELETDKATMEIESEAAGTVQKIVVGEGEMVEIHTPLAYIADSAEDVERFIAATAATAQAEAVPEKPTASAPKVEKKVASAPAVASAEGRVKASPAARRMASEKGIDLASVATGSGPGGRIITDDLEGVAASAAPAAVGAAAASGEVVRTKMTGMRRAIARNLTKSFQEIPHYYMKMTVEAEALMAAYRLQKKACRARLNDLLMLAVGRTMADFPEFRSRIEGEEVAEYPHANIGMAVALEGGLVVPVVLGVDTLSLAELAAASREAIDQARAGKPQNMGQGHFTISNLGMTDIEEFTAIINPPEAAILAVGKVTEAVKVEKGAIRATKQMTMWMSSDHRLIDGMLAAKFLGRLKRALEKPEDLV